MGNKTGYTGQPDWSTEKAVLLFCQLLLFAYLPTMLYKVFFNGTELFMLG